jgi:hypothetical protein
MITLYHRTSSRDAGRIIKSQLIKPTKANEFGPTGVYFSDVLNGHGARYGRAAVKVRIRAKDGKVQRRWPGGSENEWVFPKSALTGTKIDRVPYKELTRMPANMRKAPFETSLPKNSRALRKQRHDLAVSRRKKAAKGWKPNPTRKKAYWRS